MRGPSRALEDMAIKWFSDNGHRYGLSPISVCCEHFDSSNHDKMAANRHLKWGGLCERDLLQNAKDSIWWRHAAILAGFTLAKINAPWNYTKPLLLPDGTLLENWPDEGRTGIVLPEIWEAHIRYDAKKASVSIGKWRIL